EETEEHPAGLLRLHTTASCFEVGVLSSQAVGIAPRSVTVSRTVTLLLLVLLVSLQVKVSDGYLLRRFSMSSSPGRSTPDERDAARQSGHLHRPSICS
ncbi:hypothetical protein THAOC_24479, partial [Thalassiosira oceanica]